MTLRLRFASSLVAASALAFVLAAAEPVQAGFVTYMFNHVGDGQGNGALGEAHLFVDVTNQGVDPNNQVQFIFRNTGPANGFFIDGVYFDADALFTFDSVVDDPAQDVLFTQWARPQNLPGWQEIDPDFHTTGGLSADRKRSAEGGVHGDEWLSVIFDLNGGVTFASVIAAMENALDPTFANWGNGEDLRVGIKAQGFSDNGSESFVNGGQVPEPSTLALLTCAALTFAAGRRLRRTPTTREGA